MRMKCRVCGKPANGRACSVPCAIKLTALDKEKKARREYKEAKVKARSRGDWLKLAQITFNAYIRQRDDLEPCISCQRHHKGQYQAGHYLTTGARPELRFEEDNCHKQCSACNNHLSGNLILYRVALVKKIGLERVEWLEGPHEPAKYTIEQLKEIIATYKAKLKGLLQ